MTPTQSFFHERLSSRLELAIERLPNRRTVAFEVRLLTGMVDEPDALLGLANVTDHAINKGTAQRTGQQLSDAFDAIGAQRGSWAGREAFGFRCLCLPEFLSSAIDLHAELLRTPTFPDDACQVAVALSLQELTALEDEPEELTRRALVRQAYGARLGRHPLGTAETLARITRDAVFDFWRTHFGASRMHVAMAGPIDPEAVACQWDRSFAGFGRPPDDGRTPRPIEFTPGRLHQPKELEQEYIYFCWPGVSMTHPDHAVQMVALAILSEGMSSRLFTEVREKLGLVYSVGAWQEHPRAGGMLFAGASTTPQRCEETYRVLLREIDRLAEDLTQDELRRAQHGLITKSHTHGEITRARAAELASDLFYFGRPVPTAEKQAQINAVRVADVRRYLNENPRDRLCLVTMGPRDFAA